MAKTQADFVGQSESDYAGWYGSEKNKWDKNVGDWQAEQGKINPYFDRLFGELGETQNKANSALQSSMNRRGVLRSGITTKAEGNMANEFTRQRGYLGEQKLNRESEVGRELKYAQAERRNVDTDYQSKVAQRANEYYQNWKAEQAAAAERNSYNNNYNTDTDTTDTKGTTADPRQTFNDDVWQLENQLYHAKNTNGEHQSYEQAVADYAAAYGNNTDISFQEISSRLYDVYTKVYGAPYKKL